MITGLHDRDIRYRKLPGPCHKKHIRSWKKNQRRHKGTTREEKRSLKKKQMTGYHQQFQERGSGNKAGEEPEGRGTPSLRKAQFGEWGRWGMDKS